MSSFQTPGWAMPNDDLESIRRKMVEERAAQAGQRFSANRAMMEASGQAPPGGLLPSLNSAIPQATSKSLNSPVLEQPTPGRLQSAGPELKMNSLNPETGVNPWANYGEMLGSMFKTLTPASNPVAPQTPATPQPPAPPPTAASVPPLPAMQRPETGGMTPQSQAAVGATNALAGGASDAFYASQNAMRDATQRNRLTGMAMPAAFANQDTLGMLEKQAVLNAGRSPQGLTMSPAAPPVTPQQASGMGLNASYDSAVPAGFELVGSNLRRVAPTPTPIAGPLGDTRTSEAQAILGPSMTPAEIAASRARSEEARTRIANDPNYKTGGQRANETREQFAQRMDDIAAARASRSPASGARDRLGDTYGEQAAMRQVREASLAAMQPKPPSVKDAAATNKLNAETASIEARTAQALNKKDLTPSQKIRVDAAMAKIKGLAGAVMPDAKAIADAQGELMGILDEIDGKPKQAGQTAALPPGTETKTVKGKRIHRLPNGRIVDDNNQDVDLNSL